VKKPPAVVARARIAARSEAEKLAQKPPAQDNAPVKSISVFILDSTPRRNKTPQFALRQMVNSFVSSICAATQQSVHIALSG